MLDNSDGAKSTFMFWLLENKDGGSMGATAGSLMDNMGGGGITYLRLSPLPTQDGPLQENYLLGGQTPVTGGKKRREE